MICRRVLGRLLAGLLLLPVALLLLLGVAGILVSMGDQEGARWMTRLAALVGVAWGVDLVALVAASALRLWSTIERDGASSPGESPQHDELEP